jgi:hypothetical protein
VTPPGIDPVDRPTSSPAPQPLRQPMPHLLLVKKVKVSRNRPRIFLTFDTTRLVGHQPYAPAAFTPGEIPGTYFQRLCRPQVTWFRR